jgi:hypothetical protein
MLAGICCPAIVIGASWLTDSLGLWLVVAVGSMAVLDGVLLGIVGRRDWRRVGKCAGAAAVTGLTLFFGAGGSIAWLEACYVGGLVGLTLASLDLLASLMMRWPACATALAGTKGRLLKGVAAITFLAGVAFLAPVATTLHLVHSNSLARPTDLGLDFEEVAFRTDDGLLLRGWYVPCEQPRGVVVYCHGHGSNRGQVLGVLRTLSDRQLDVLAFDFRGHGASGGHTATFGEREVADVVAAHRFATARRPDRPVFLVGVSYGAAVSIQALPQLPDVRAAWLEAPFARFANVADNKLAAVPPWLRRPLLEAYNVRCGSFLRSNSPTRMR